MVAMTVPVKTPDGVAELSQRLRKLGQRQRTLLLLVDGKRSEQEVRRMASAAGVPDTCFDELCEMGLIAVPTVEVVTEPAPLMDEVDTPRPAVEAARVDAAAEPAAVDAGADADAGAAEPVVPEGAAEPAIDEPAIDEPVPVEPAVVQPVPAQPVVAAPAAAAAFGAPERSLAAFQQNAAPTPSLPIQAPSFMTSVDTGLDSTADESLLPAARTLQPDGDSVDWQAAVSLMHPTALRGFDGDESPFEEARDMLVRAVRAVAPVAGSLTARRLKRARTREELVALLDEVEQRIVKPPRELSAQQTLRRVRRLLDLPDESALPVLGT